MERKMAATGGTQCAFSTEYKLIERSILIDKPMKNFGAYKLEQQKNIGSPWTINEVGRSTAYKNNFKIVKCENQGKVSYIIEEVVTNINVFPEMLLGTIALGTGLIGIIATIAINAPGGIIPMLGFVGAGLA